jgi:hypothetical protein
MRRLLVVLLCSGGAASSVSLAAANHVAAQRQAPGKATLATFAGTWIGHTRGLRIRRDGHATESIYSGCCDPALNLTFRLSRPGGTTNNATATALVTGVWVRDRNAFTKAYPPPQVGEVRVIRLRNGVIGETLSGTDYCDTNAENEGKCGA